MYPFISLRPRNRQPKVDDFDPFADYSKMQKRLEQYKELIYEEVKKKKDEELKKQVQGRWKFILLLLILTSWPVAIFYKYMANHILEIMLR